MQNFLITIIAGAIPCGLLLFILTKPGGNKLLSIFIFKICTAVYYFGLALILWKYMDSNTLNINNTTKNVILISGILPNVLMLIGKLTMPNLFWKFFFKFSSFIFIAGFLLYYLQK